MPKVKRSTRKDVDFRVDPWQTKQKKQSSQCAVPNDDEKYIPFSAAPEVHAAQEPRTALSDKQTRAWPELVDAATPWLSTAPVQILKTQPDICPSEVTQLEETSCWAADAAKPSQIVDLEGECPEQVADEEDDDFDLPPGISSGTNDVTGMCQLALLPSGHMSGHVADARSKRAYGIIARCVNTSSDAPECMDDEDVEFLKIRLLNFETSEEVEALVCRTGGDMARIVPAEIWQVRQHLDIQDSDQLERVMKLQVSFWADQLYEGQAAEQQLSMLNSKLLGRDAVVNMGAMEIKGLPSGF